MLAELADQLHANGSWCGETHVQKATYFLQELTAVPLGVDFILYKHGPFSFDLRDEITEMRANGFADLQPQPPYGPSIVAGPNRELLRDYFGEQSAGFAAEIKYIASRLGTMGVAELERVATALYVTRSDDQDLSVDRRARQIVELKPHIKFDQAVHAVRQVDQMLLEWNGNG